jgi:light-regulated signal transduction histidine kinase (bacteriophytochrome)
MHRPETRKSQSDRPSTGRRIAELQDQVDRLLGSNRDLNDFAHIVSHELKEPLAGMRALCEILLEDYEGRLDLGAERRLGALVEMCDRLANSIRSLRAYCQTGGVPQSDDEVDLNDVAEDVLRTLRPRIDALAAEVRVVDRLPAVRGDATLIGHVLVNLAANGLKFNRSVRPSVQIGVLPGDPPAIYVRDNGIGIAEEHHREVFTIFRRLHARRQYEGTGAGLSIARRIVESHGGRIWVESAPGQGSTFFFTLGPTRADAPASRAPTKPPHWVDRETARGRSGRRVRR